MRAYLIQQIPDPHGPEPVPSGTISSTRPTGYSTAAIEIVGFKKGIMREIAIEKSVFTIGLISSCVDQFNS